MPGPFEPLLKPKDGDEDAGVAATLGVGGLSAGMTEPFVSETQTKTILGDVFKTVGLMIVAAFFMWFFYWAYAKEKQLFMAILSGLLFLYTLTVVSVTVTYRAKFSSPMFAFLMGSSAFVAFMTLISTIFFSVRASQRLRGASGSSSGAYDAPAYVPPAVQQYVSDRDAA